MAHDQDLHCSQKRVVFKSVTVILRLRLLMECLLYYMSISDGLLHTEQY